jgi:hypothetical protein
MAESERLRQREGTPVSEILARSGRAESLPHRGTGPRTPARAYKISIRSGKISLSPVRKITGRNIVSIKEVEDFAGRILPEGGGEREITAPRLGGWIPPEQVEPPRREGYGREVSPDSRFQGLTPTTVPRGGISRASPMDTRGGSGLVPSGDRLVETRPNASRPQLNTRRPESPVPQRIPPDIEHLSDLPPRPVPPNIEDEYFVSPEERERALEAGQKIRGGAGMFKRGGKTRKKYYKGGRIKKYAKGGGIRKAKY